MISIACFENACVPISTVWQVPILKYLLVVIVFPLGPYDECIFVRLNKISLTGMMGNGLRLMSPNLRLINFVI